MAPVPEGAQRSEDGYYWWDGTAWQQIPENERTSASSAATATSPSAAGSAGLSHEDLAKITHEDQLDEKSKPYFQPDADKVPDDPSEAEGTDVLSDEPAATGSS